MTTAEVKISELPEEVTADGLKIYGPASYETQVAILSQYLHTLKGKHDIASGEKRDEILEAIRDFIEYKRQQDKKNPMWNIAAQIMARDLWTRDEMILVLNLYLKLPFSKMDRRNPDVIHLADIIGRTPNAVALRLVNYASYDPILQRRGISGMAHGGKKCGEFWHEFINDRERLLFESERILAEREGTTIEKKYEQVIRDIPQDLVGETKLRQVKTRVNQNIFRQIVLANYEGKCALTGIDLSELLVASHIIPWADNEQERLNPENGICLSSLYDKAFDKGLISFTNEKHVIFSIRLKENVGKEYYAKYFEPIENATLVTPRKYHINPQFLEWHRDCIFNK